MRHELKKEIQNARPSLKVVSPLTHWVISSLGIFNILFGVILFLAMDANRVSAPLLIVNELFTYQMWGIIFIVLGVIKLLSLYTNNWSLAKKSLLLGVAIKSTWAIALAVRSFISPGTFLVNMVWVTLAAIQIGTYIYFMPPAIGGNTQQRRNKRD